MHLIKVSKHLFTLCMPQVCLRPSHSLAASFSKSEPFPVNTLSSDRSAASAHPSPQPLSKPNPFPGLSVSTFSHPVLWDGTKLNQGDWWGPGAGLHPLEIIHEAFHCCEQEHLVTVTQSLSCLTEISHFERLNLAGQKMRKIPNPDCEGKHLSEANTTLIPWLRSQEAGAPPRHCCILWNSGHSLVRAKLTPLPSRALETRTDFLITQTHLPEAEFEVADSATWWHLCDVPAHRTHRHPQNLTQKGSKMSQGLSAFNYFSHLLMLSYLSRFRWIW